MYFELQITIKDGRLTVIDQAEGQRVLLSSIVLTDGRMTEETATMVAKLVGTRVADALREMGGSDGQ